jgi:hypothetical protein
MILFILCVNEKKYSVQITIKREHRLKSTEIFTIDGKM